MRCAQLNAGLQARPWRLLTPLSLYAQLHTVFSASRQPYEFFGWMRNWWPCWVLVGCVHGRVILRLVTDPSTAGVLEVALSASICTVHTCLVAGSLHQPANVPHVSLLWHNRTMSSFLSAVLRYPVMAFWLVDGV